MLHPMCLHTRLRYTAVLLGGLVLAGPDPLGPAPAHAQVEGLKKRQAGARPAVEPATSTAKPKASPGPAAPAPADASPGAREDDVPLLQRIVGFIRGYATWILVVLGVATVVTVALTLLGRRRSSGEVESALAELGLEEPPARAQKFSSTKIAAADVTDRLGVKTSEVETDREYALVVDEEALKMPPLPEDAGAPSHDPGEIRKRLARKDLEGAYSEYAGVLEANPSASVDPEVERSLGEELLRARQLDRAVRVLEHHVVTHRARGIPPECYFNLGYVHFLRKTYKKATRFLKLFVMAGKNPEHVERAKKLLERIEKAGNLN
jgi:hypothetical protein